MNQYALRTPAPEFATEKIRGADPLLRSYLERLVIVNMDDFISLCIPRTYLLLLANSNCC